jgi:2-oxoisovalerate dehydrogenase E1 component alpha subunit
VDCIKEFEALLEKEGVLTRQQMDELRGRYIDAMAAAANQASQEPLPAPETIWNHIYAEKK